MFRRKSRNMFKGLQVSREEFLKAKPIRNPALEWSRDQKGVHLMIPRRNLFGFLPLAREKRIVLDEQGSFIWNLCDGKNSIKAIAESLNSKYDMPISHAQAALDIYFVQLSKQGLVGFVLPESTRKRYRRLSLIPKREG